MSEVKTIRKIQSFVRRSGRLTVSQKYALENLSDKFVIKKPYNWHKLWDNNQNIIMEIGFGNGDSLIKMALQSENNNYIGIEVYKAGIGKILNNIFNEQINNLKIITDDAALIIQQMPSNYLTGILIFFPDPWHKKKHNKRRLINNDFLNLIAKKLKKNSTIHLATDYQHYALQMMELLERNIHFSNTVKAYNFNDNNLRPMTKFELRGKKLGHTIYDLIFIKQ